MQLLDLERNRTVLRLEVQHRDPVVGEVFYGYTAGAGGLGSHVGAEGGVQGVTTDELMEIGGSCGDARVHYSERA